MDNADNTQSIQDTDTSEKTKTEKNVSSEDSEKAPKVGYNLRAEHRPPQFIFWEG